MAWWSHYIGTPYDQMHCWQLVRRVYADRLGIVLPEYGEISARDLLRVARVMADASAAPPWVAVEQPRAMDVVVMSGRTRIAHVGVMIDGDRSLHTSQAAGCILSSVTNPAVAGRVRGYRRHMSEAFS